MSTTVISTPNLDQGGTDISGEAVDAEPPEKNGYVSPAGNLNKAFLGKTILIVNTGSSTKRFILERLKQLGFTIVLLNKKKNWAKPFVNHWILADTYNHEESIETLRRFLLKNPRIHIDGATTFWEDDIPLLSRICKEFSYIGNDISTADNTRSKFVMHEKLKEKGRPFIPQHLLEEKSDLAKAIKTIGFPAVIKPQYGSDSQYVICVNNSEEAYKAYDYVRENCTPEYDPIYNYNKEKFVYQRFIEGKEFSVECYAQNGVPHVVGINEKTAMELPFFMETGDYCPPRINLAKTDVLVEEAKATLLAMGVKNSVAHIEIKMTRQGPKVIEVASRMGGVYICQNIKTVYGFDLIQAAAEIACGIPVTQRPTLPQKYLLAKFFIPRKSGVITAMDGFDLLQSQKNVLGVFIGKKVHETIAVPPQGYEALGWVLTGGKSYKEAEQNMDEIMRSVNYEVALPKEQHVFVERELFRQVPVQMGS